MIGRPPARLQGGMRLKLELGDLDACLSLWGARAPRQRLLQMSAMARAPVRSTVRCPVRFQLYALILVTLSAAGQPAVPAGSAPAGTTHF